MLIFQNQNIQKILEENNLGTFDDIWKIEKNWVEEPNIKSENSWSGVVKYTIINNNLGQDIYIKLQQNYFKKTATSPIKGIPTIEKEFNSIKLLEKNNIPNLTPYLFAKRKEGSDIQTILITKALSDSIPLDEYLKKGELSDELIQKLAKFIKNMHNLKIQHGALYDKHIFINLKSKSFNLIDLENTRKVFSFKKAQKRDLSRLLKKSNWNNELVDKFNKYYYET